MRCVALAFMQEVNKRVCLCVQACTLARRTAETFLKYVNRNLHFLGMQMKFRSPEGHVKGKNGQMHTTLLSKNLSEEGNYEDVVG